MVFVFWTYLLGIIPCGSLHVVTNGETSSILYGWVIPLVCRYCMVTIPSSVDGLLHCSHILNTVTNAKRNVMVHISFYVSYFFVSLSTQKWNYGHMVLVFSFLWKLHSIFQGDCTNLNPNNNEIFFSSTPSPSHVTSDLSDTSHSGFCEVAPHCGFDVHFCEDQWHWEAFHVPSGHLYIFTGKMPTTFFFWFFNFFLLFPLSEGMIPEKYCDVLGWCPDFSISVLSQDMYGFKSYTEILNPYWIYVCATWKKVIRFHLLAGSCLIFATPFIEERVLSPLYILRSFFVDNLAI